MKTLVLHYYNFYQSQILFESLIRITILYK